MSVGGGKVKVWITKVGEVAKRMMIKSGRE